MIQILALLIFANIAQATPQLRFIDDINYSTGKKFQATEIGGLSGIAFDKAQKKILVISDDKSLINPARFYEFKIELTSNSFKLTPEKVVKLRNSNGQYFKKDDTDFEGISLWENDILISSEGKIEKAHPVPPGLMRFKRNGHFISNIDIPEKFLSPKKESTDKNYGVRNNKAFETLSVALNTDPFNKNRALFMAAEESLFQDGPASSGSEHSFVRIIRYKNLKPINEFAYKLEKIKNTMGIDALAADNGLVDMAAVDDKNFYTLERSFLPMINRNYILIFKCAVNQETTDISKIPSLKNNKFTSVEKTLVANLDDFLTQMKPAKLDNIEGIAFGPDLPNGHKTLILVSDNNFGWWQRTQFLAFEIVE